MVSFRQSSCAFKVEFLPQAHTPTIINKSLLLKAVDRLPISFWKHLLNALTIFKRNDYKEFGGISLYLTLTSALLKNWRTQDLTQFVCNFNTKTGRTYVENRVLNVTSFFSLMDNIPEATITLEVKIQKQNHGNEMTIFPKALNPAPNPDWVRWIIGLICATICYFTFKFTSNKEAWQLQRPGSL